MILWRQQSNSKHGQDCQADFSRLSKQVVLLRKSMMGIFWRDQPQIVFREVLCQLLAYGCFIQFSGANGAQSPGLGAELLHCALLFVTECCTEYQTQFWVAPRHSLDSVLPREKIKNTRTKKNPKPTKIQTQSSLAALVKFSAKGRERRGKCRI